LALVEWEMGHHLCTTCPRSLICTGFDLHCTMHLLG
jgi:hypothetical protein